MYFLYMVSYFTFQNFSDCLNAFICILEEEITVHYQCAVRHYNWNFFENISFWKKKYFRCYSNSTFILLICAFWKGHENREIILGQQCPQTFPTLYLFFTFIKGNYVLGYFFVYCVRFPLLHLAISSNLCIEKKEILHFQNKQRLQLHGNQPTY